ncbi:NAD(P)-dependent oxidoreductase, partial [Pseudacidovorax intermedius]|uniref:NAD(P)-dependent oxidoreductase n=1 Tax=Pseudacidovorax intermedius TaxID=433924 RepID=UPI000733DFDA
MKTIGVIGLGNMGRGMALTLQRKGFDVIGTDAAPATRAALAGEGLTVVDTVQQVAARADLLVLSLPTAAIVAQVVAGPGGLLDVPRDGLLVVDTSTSHPDTTRRLAGQLEAAGMSLIDAPVSGGPRGALAGTMTMVIGGSEADVARAMMVLQAMSAKRVHVGPVGAGHVAKIANNLLCAAHLALAGADGARAMMVLQGMSAKGVDVGAVGAGHVAKIGDNLLCGASLEVDGEGARVAEKAVGHTGRVRGVVNDGGVRRFVTEV